MRGSGQRLPITLRFTRVLGTFSHTTCFPFSCALWACFSDRSVSGERSEPIGALMPHAALWVVQPKKCGFQCRTRLCGWCSEVFSMKKKNRRPFQCRTRLCGWCSHRQFRRVVRNLMFQCRTRLCGWSNKKCLSTEFSVDKFQCRTRLCGWCNAQSC